jgi:hypothetical protein
MDGAGDCAQRNKLSIGFIGILATLNIYIYHS